MADAWLEDERVTKAEAESLYRVLKAEDGRVLLRVPVNEPVDMQAISDFLEDNDFGGQR